ncbi:hypothetical protein POSPLADRAFT_1062400 [Postia placenta MAD-698-R-SB12]|uniref:Uncharacterized protein n=1 Tax=Postia placenta MAD-698-R-SB12 TaxID=670580 RepID=A0A1X6MJQ3_9APHY|nr:hypothetical protein POSPLADRAFT_1062400 [Postia placenta MAD-698-R-SB12]OSX56575.1 hypothetical protein POSPLADRAFT_1062400 [Postia placenta MAD-698-R-SB12]
MAPQSTSHAGVFLESEWIGSAILSLVLPGSIKGFEPEERDDDETLEWLDEPATVIRGESGFVAANEVNLNDPDIL